LFRAAAEGSEHRFFNAPHIIDVHGLPEDLRKLTVFLMLDKLYSEIMAMPDAPLDGESNRQVRLIIVIDEAHHYLPCKQPTLEKMIREVRSKGVSIWLLSQSPDDFDQPRYNFAREMGLALVFSCVLEKPKMLEAILGGKVNPQRLSQLAAGVALTRLASTDAPMEVQAWKP
jgi:DNA sulfur modification protein DndE